MVSEDQQTVTPESEFRLKLHEPSPAVLEEYASQRAPQSPSQWFCLKFPDQVALYGAPVLEELHRWTDQNAQIEAVALNEDFFAGVLGCNKQLGHHVVFYQPEQ